MGTIVVRDMPGAAEATVRFDGWARSSDIRRRLLRLPISPVDIIGHQGFRRPPVVIAACYPFLTAYSWQGSIHTLLETGRGITVSQILKFCPSGRIGSRVQVSQEPAAREA